MLPSFEYHRVTSVAEAIAIFNRYPQEAKIYAGGTDLLLELSKGKAAYKHLVSLKKITELNKFGVEQGRIVIGANVTHAEVQGSPPVKERLGALADAVCRIGSLQIRNVATVAGNICNAAPSADTASPLLVLDATVQVVGSKGERWIKLSDFFKGPGRTCLEPDEVLLYIYLPEPKTNSASAYFKLQKRKAMDLALAGAAANVECTPDQTAFVDVKIALNTVAPTPIRAYRAEEVLKGQAIDKGVIAKAAEAASLEAAPRTSWRSTAQYRREMVKVLVRDAVYKALERLNVAI